MAKIKGMGTTGCKDFDKIYVVMEDDHFVTITLPKGSNSHVVSRRLEYLAREVRSYGEHIDKRNLDDM